MDHNPMEIDGHQVCELQQVQASRVLERIDDQMSESCAELMVDGRRKRLVIVHDNFLIELRLCHHYAFHELTH